MVGRVGWTGAGEHHGWGAAKGSEASMAMGHLGAVSTNHTIIVGQEVGDAMTSMAV
jgi:hypothetical protein